MTHELSYPGRELDAMSFAINYHKWIFERFRPHLGKRVVEVGAGVGSFSELILGNNPESVSLVEPCNSMFKLLDENVGRLTHSAILHTYNATFCQVADKLKIDQKPDSIIYVNVLEHIADDEAELTTVHQTLDRGGKLFIFVPAMPWLFSKFDAQLGHFRRYTENELAGKCRTSGFRVLTSSYFDCMGVVPWWLKFKVLRSTSMEPTSVRRYDKFVVPLGKCLEAVIKPPFGKNVLVVAERT